MATAYVVLFDEGSAGSSVLSVHLVKDKAERALNIYKQKYPHSIEPFENEPLVIEPFEIDVLCTLYANGEQL